jgi:hypothetical protein
MPLQNIPAPPTEAAQPAPATAVVAPPAAAPTAAEMYQAARALRRELGNQLERAEDRRDDLRQQLTQTPQSETTTRAGLEARLQDTDARIVALDKEIALADQRVAQAAAVPGATIEPPRPQITREGPPEEVFMLGGMFIFFVMMPLAIGWARRLWKRAAVAVSTEMPAELNDRLSRMEQAIDAVAVELERVGEGQRYVTRVFSEQQRALGAGSAEPLDVRQREAIQQSRP